MEAPLGAAGDVGMSHAFAFRADPAADGVGSLERIEVPSVASSADEGVVGRGLLVEEEEHSGKRRLVSWRAQGSGIWVEERGIDMRFVEVGVFLKLRGEGERLGASCPLDPRSRPVGQSSESGVALNRPGGMLCTQERREAKPGLHQAQQPRECLG